MWKLTANANHAAHGDLLWLVFLWGVLRGSGRVSSLVPLVASLTQSQLLHTGPPQPAAGSNQEVCFYPGIQGGAYARYQNLKIPLKH